MDILDSIFLRSYCSPRHQPFYLHVVVPLNLAEFRVTGDQCSVLNLAEGSSKTVGIGYWAVRFKVSRR